MAQRYARVDVEFMHKRTARKLLDELGLGGPLVFLALILKAKDGAVPGVFTYTSEAAAWEKLGLEGVEVGFTLDEFLKVTGRLKQTSRTPVGRLMNVQLTRYADWQKDAKRYEEAVKKARTRAHSTGDTNGTPQGTPKGRKGGPRSRPRSIPLTPREEGTNPRAKGTSPRQRGRSPRQTGTSPRDLGTNPRATQPHPNECPHCHSRQRTRAELEDHIRYVHYDQHGDATADVLDDDIPF